jgi:hypothetical protein
VQFAILRQPLHRHDFAPVDLRREDEAGVHRLAIEQDGACATRANLAAALRAQQAQLVAQQVKQRAVGRDTQLVRAAIDRSGDKAFPDRFAFSASPECNANLGPVVRVEDGGSAGMAASNGQAGNSTLKATGCFQLLGEKEGFSLGLRFGYIAPCLRVTALVNCMALTSARSRQSGYGSFHKRRRVPNMAKNSKTLPVETEAFCRSEINRMLKNSQTKVIMPVVTLGLLREFVRTGQRAFLDPEIKKAYEAAVRSLKVFLGHDVHIGARYYDAYGTRMSRYTVLKSVGHLKYELLAPYSTFASGLCEWIPVRIRSHIEQRLGVVPLLSNPATRVAYAEDKEKFLGLIQQQIDKTPANFEIFSFAVIKVHLEKFACKVYRDTRTSAHDKGVDLSTNFGVVYQVKKLRVYTESEADRIYAELKGNFDSERLQDGNVILVIDDISKDVKKYLIDMKVHSISKSDLLKMVVSFEDPEDRQKVLRIVYEEFRREYSSTLK